MKKQILILAMLLFSTIFYAQNTRISIGPKTFKKEIACKINLPKQTDLVIRIFDEEKIVKQFIYKNVKITAVKMDLEALEMGKTYTISVFDNKKHLLHQQKIKKAIQ